jgi:ABC-type multidrug transport system fused ATPase/permease subunit
VFFDKANIAAVVSGILYFVLYLPYTILIQYQDVITFWQQFLASLSSTVAFSYGCAIIGSFELENVGLNWQNFYENPYVGQESLTMSDVCLILCLDSVIYMLLAWYIEGVKPGEYGVPRRFYFPIQPSYWFGERCLKSVCKRKSSSSKKSGISSFFSKKLESCFGIISKDEIIAREEANREMPNHKSNIDYKLLQESLENVDKNLEAGIEINNLHKVYSRANNHALKGLSVKFYKNEISAFLGHNGAGKSTTMHLLTGLYTPTSGHAKINGI